MSRSRKPLTICLVALAAFAAGAAFFAKSARCGDEEPVANVRTTSLNEVLTNEMSSVEELSNMDRDFEKYLQTWNMRGASVAIMRGDSLLYAKGYGKADEDVDMGPGNILRLASVSKLITGIAVMKAAEEGLLSLDSKVFGSEGILSGDLYKTNVRDSLLYNRITVEHLLRHQAGFSRDPMFSSLDVSAQLGLSGPPSREDFIGLVLSRRLRFTPGEWQRYSNFGYMLLGRVIETVSGEKYEDYVQNHVLRPAGCLDMHLADNYYAEKRVNEVRYYTHEGDGKYVPEYNGSGEMVERCYGGNNIPLLEGAGAWVSSAAEIAKLVAAIDGDPTEPDILSKESIDKMVEYKDPDTYSLGWNDTNPEKGWVRTGTLSGTTAIIKRFPDGECWIFISNTSTWKGPGHAKYTSALFDRCREKYSDKLPSVNLFEKAD